MKNLVRMDAALAIVLVCGAFAAGPALAQQPPAPPDAVAPQAQPAPPALDPKACAGRNRATTGSATAPDQGLHVIPHDETVSEKLAETEGVICPPAEIDPDIQAHPSGGGRTPVIPPPGSLGGDPSTRPK
jgi:hypothetical protein